MTGSCLAQLAGDVSWRAGGDSGGRFEWQLELELALVAQRLRAAQCRGTNRCVMCRLGGIRSQEGGQLGEL